MKLRAELRGDSDIVATKNASREKLTLTVDVDGCEVSLIVDPNNGFVIFQAAGNTSLLGQIVDGGRRTTFVEHSSTTTPRRQP